MLEMFAALISAHLLADFVLQFDCIAKAKKSGKRNILGWAMIAHAIIVAATAIIAIGAATLSAAILIIIITLSHVCIDLGKIFLDRWSWLNQFKRAELWTFWIDQIAHIAVLAAAASMINVTLSDGFWWQVNSNIQTLTLIHIHLAGFITATRVGQFSIAMFMVPFRRETENSSTDEETQNLSPPGGAWIGLIERSIIYGLVFLGQVAAIGFVIALKSLLRFKETKIASEYLIIGSLISITWAYSVAQATKFVIENWSMTI